MKPSLLLAALLLAACAPEPAKPDAPLNPATDFRPVTGEADLTDISRFLAGRPVNRGSDLSQIQRGSGGYHRHALEMDYRWRTFGSKRSLRHSQWYQESLRPVLGSPATVVYPFGGPDLLYASSMFPRASTYVLLGLEPVGDIPDLQSSPEILLDRLARVMEEPLRHGYFITDEMRNAPPVTPILLTTLGLMGARVDSVSAIDAGGKPGVEIRFRPASGGSKRVIYVSGDISNRGFSSSFQSWLGGYSGSTAYFKAASYLMHDGNFSDVRNWVLGNCRSVLQDDSGIPFRYYDPGDWDVRLFGTYERPIPVFARWRQPDLAAAYDALGGRGPEIPFGSGYHLRIDDANLQVLTRK